MVIDKTQIAEIVKRVLAQMQEQISGDEADGIFTEMDDAIVAASEAQKKLTTLSLNHRSKIVEAMREEARAHVELFARMAREETGMGRYEDKVQKNLLAVNKTPGIEDLTTEAFTGDGGLTLVEYAPFGVIGAITPSTNPTETIICNSIGMVAAGNAVVFSPHPGAKATSLKAISVLNRAIRKAGGPANLLTTVAEPSLERVRQMIAHPEVDLLVATGGPGVVKAVLSSGKKAIAAGAGNPPVIVDETADIQKAARDIIAGGSLDNNLPCIAEKEIIAVESIADYLLFQFRQNGGYVIEDQAIIKELTDLLVKDGRPNKEFIGKDIQVIMGAVGIEVPKDVRAVVVEVDMDHPFVQEEMMMPVLPLVRVPDIDRAIEVAVEVEHGNHHTAVIHSKNIDNMTRFAQAAKTTIFVKNGPSYAGIGMGGEGFTSFTIAGATGEGLTSARSFARKRRCVLVGGLSLR